MNPSSPRGRLRDALCVGERGDVDEAGRSAAVTAALRELAREALGERSRVELVTVGAEDHPWGRSLGLRLADYDVELLDSASETPDNKDAARRIAVLHTGEPRLGPCLCLSHSGASFAEVVLSVDGCPVPSCVLEQLPDLTQDEWNAVIHVTGLTLMAFGPEPAREVG